MAVFIEGVGVGSYRSFRDPLEFLAPFGDVNVIIGPNNSGKSNLLRYIRDVAWPISRNDGVKSESFSGSRIQLGINKTKVLDKLSETDRAMGVDSKLVVDWIWSLKQSKGDVAFFDFEKNGVRSQIPREEILNETSQIRDETYRLWQSLHPSSSGGESYHWVNELLDRFYGYTNKNKDLIFIPAFRNIPSKLEEYHSEYGAFSSQSSNENDIIWRLNELANPKHTEFDQKRAQFNRLVSFVKEVTNNESIDLSIPSDLSTINVHIDGGHRAIEELGSGVHELVLLAAEIVLKSDTIVLLEEPEVHLHPTLQRSLMKFISEANSNQFFITTHSSTIIDTENVAVWHSSLIEGRTKIRRALSQGERYTAVRDLGVRPSDLIQTNCVIWVEGPSDRIYLNHWITSFDNKLIEGRHYSIMFYGGGLVSHLTLEDDLIVENLISLLSISRASAIMIDSDHDSSKKRISGNKLRIKNEASENGSFFWLTKGRTIENYLAPESREAAIKETHPRIFEKLSSSDLSYGQPLQFESNGKNKKETANKVKVAHYITENYQADFSILDLRTKVRELVAFINNANS